MDCRGVGVVAAAGDLFSFIDDAYLFSQYVKNFIHLINFAVNPKC